MRQSIAIVFDANRIAKAVGKAYYEHMYIQLYETPSVLF